MSLPRPKLTPQEYLEVERRADWKSEYYGGQMFAMAGANARHEGIKTNIASELHAQFKGRSCQAFTSDMRVKVTPTGLYTYPDVVAFCEPARYEDDHQDVLLNPAIIFEVLSPSTEGYDRGRKFDQYGCST